MSTIEPDDMASAGRSAFKARDGARPVRLPDDAQARARRKLPMVLLPHGGPHGPYDSWFFDTDAQFLASRGYAVLQVNFRGSGGRGVEFEHAGYRQWGAKIQDDLIDGVKWAIAQGEVDGNRVCAYGASFGGYSALMLAAREPAMFKCAVGYAGIYDLNLLSRTTSTRREQVRLQLPEEVHRPGPAELNRFSPMTAGQPDQVAGAAGARRQRQDRADRTRRGMRAALIKAGPRAGVAAGAERRPRLLRHRATAPCSTKSWRHSSASTSGQVDEHPSAHEASDDLAIIVFLHLRLLINAFMTISN